ncbi:unnamed protein product [Lymnaea stagnalis]|uniref:Glycosylphosphatidylinositol anchor attachment 1 protein n=1 Tax=Lymnaea stagnalis TaxID=6523 RepID=A0AAV2HKW2_LYMST
MGFLTDEKQRGRLITLLERHHHKLSLLSYIIGLGGFLALAYQPLNASTYFSENALLPGLVETELPRTLDSATVYRKELEEEMKTDTKLSPHKWIYSKFRELGLETFTQNFSVVYPFKSVSARVVAGENVYSILRARRTASTEALVLSVPLRPLANKAKTGTGGGIALALALAKEFKQKPYWSKDIIFLFTDFDEIGAMAWLDGYHQTDSQYIIANDLEGRSGAIIAAINLELPLENVNYFNVKLEGLNGQLPNLDLVNLVVKLCRRERAQVMLHHMSEDRGYIHSEHGDTFKDYKQALSTMLKMMWYQASGAPSGNHGLFQKFHIESVSLEGVVKKGQRQSDIHATAKIIEGIFRSLNNLLERFHQSFFFYLLPSTSRYVSIGMYMPWFGLMALAGLIQGIVLWLATSEDPNKQEGEPLASSKETSDATMENKDKLDESISEREKDNNAITRESPGASEDDKVQDSGDIKDIPEDQEEKNGKKDLVSIVPVILVAMLLGWMAHQGPELLTRIMPRFRIQTEDMILYSMLAIFTAALVYPKLMKKKASESNILNLNWKLLKSVALVLQTLALTSLSLMNISLAFFLTALMVPVTTLVRPCNNRFLRLLQMAALVLVSPMSLMLMVGIISSVPQDSPLELITQGFANSKELIFLGVMDAHLFNAWTETVITAVVFPVWLMFWAIPWIDSN